MKGLYTIGMGLSIALFSTQAIAQIQQVDAEPTNPLTAARTNKTVKQATPKGTSETIVYWAEDFSNGMDGMLGQDGDPDNGPWDTDEDQGDLWFITYPVGATDGYDPALGLVGASDLYGTNIPNYFGDRDVCASPTRDNGVVMLDGDRFNSTSTEEAPDGTLIQDPFLSSLISPAFNLTDVDNALLTFYHYSRVCCSGYSLSADLSVDNGATWIPYDVYTPFGAPNEDVDIQVSLNISDVLQGAADLTQCRVRFFWNGSQSHYFWSIDDIAIVSLPENDLQAGETWYGNYYDLVSDFEADVDPLPAVDYYNSFEYLITPDYYARPLNFAMVVTNAGSEIQTDVKLIVTGTAPDGTSIPFPEAAGISLESGVTDTLTIPEVLLTDIASPVQYGNYTFEYEVSQAETDERPDDNIGATRGTNISTEADDDGTAIYFNGENSYGGAYTTLGQDVIWGNNYVFPNSVDNNYITHIEAVFLYSEDFAETIAGEVVYFNVRLGSVLEEDDEDPETMTTVFFDSENPITYEDSELEFVIDDDQIWQSTDGQPFVWASFELPVAILIEPGMIYQAEYRIPAAGDGIVFPPTPQGEQENYGSVLYDFADGAWFTLGTNVMPLRFRTSTITGLEDVTYESGITLIQNYPNPFNNLTRIQYSLDETQEASLEIHDMAGKLVFAEDLGMVSANAANSYMLEKGSLSAGVYTYSIATATSRVTRKLTVE